MKRFDEICFDCGADEKEADVVPGYTIGEEFGEVCYDDVPLCVDCRSERGIPDPITEGD